MKVFVALLKREWWEHRGVFIWSPLVIFALIVVFWANLYLFIRDAPILFY